MSQLDPVFIARPGVGGGRWRSRTGYANLVRALVAVAPLTIGLTVSFVANRYVPVDAMPLVLRWGVLGLFAFLVVKLVDKAARRFLPLAALLDLSLSFPDAAPSRVRIALGRASEEELQRRIDEVRTNGLSPEPAEAAEQVLQLVSGLSQHDRITRGHAERVRGYTRLIAEEMGLPEDEVDQLQWAGLLHDIGKIAIPAEILNKPGRLTSTELEVMRTHPVEGEAIVVPLKAWLGEAILAVSQHHERWDGGGYPYGIAGEDISLAARIVSVADVFDVITARRSYKEARSPAEARQELVRCAGTQFDPEVVRAFLNVSVRKVWWMVGPIAWIGQVPAVASVQSVGSSLASAGGSAAVAAAVVAPAAAVSVPPPSAVDAWAMTLAVAAEATDAPEDEVGAAAVDAIVVPAQAKAEDKVAKKAEKQAEKAETPSVHLELAAPKSETKTEKEARKATPSATDDLDDDQGDDDTDDDVAVLAQPDSEMAPDAASDDVADTGNDEHGDDEQADSPPVDEPLLAVSPTTTEAVNVVAPDNATAGPASASRGDKAKATNGTRTGSAKGKSKTR